MAARQRFDQAVEGLRAAVAIYAAPGEGMSFWRPSQMPGLRQLQQAGLELVEPEGDPGDVNEDFANFFLGPCQLGAGGQVPG